MNIVKSAIVLLAITSMTACANKNVPDSTTITENAPTAVAATPADFDAENVATAMCNCMEDAIKTQKTKKVTINEGAMASMQKRCEKQGLESFGNFKGDKEKVVAVNQKITEICAHLSASVDMQLQHRVMPTKDNIKMIDTQKQMLKYKENSPSKPNNSGGK
ncbi:MAG: hypothetical protein AAGK47_00440 [Bacteroidota bacterium]